MKERKRSCTQRDPMILWISCIIQLHSSVNYATQAKKPYNTKAFRFNEGNLRMTWRVVKDVTSLKCWRNGSRSKDGWKLSFV